MGRFGVADAGAGAQDGVRDLLHGLVLADDPLMQRWSGRRSSFSRSLSDELGDRDAGPAGDDVGNFFFGHAVTKQAGFLLGLGQLSPPLPAAFAGSGSLPYLQLSRPWHRSYSLLRRLLDLGRWWLPSRRAGSAPCSMAFFSFSHCAFLAVEARRAARPAPSAASARRCLRQFVRLLLDSAASSISSWMMRVRASRPARRAWSPAPS